MSFASTVVSKFSTEDNKTIIYSGSHAQKINDIWWQADILVCKLLLDPVMMLGLDIALALLCLGANYKKKS